MKASLITIGSIIALIVLIFAANEFEIFGVKFWGVRKQNAQRQVFEQSQSFIEGKRQELIKYHHEWMKADSIDKISIEYTIRMSFANFDENNIEQSDLRDFLIKVKRE